MNTKVLRQKILDLAIHGKLVPQDPNDEPATVLLERIRAEKQQMVKDGKLKPKDIKNDSVIFVGEDNLHYEQFPDGTVKCIEDEIPFELPEGWAWCRLANITSKTGAGSTPSGGAAIYKSDGIKFIRSQNVYNSGLILDDVAYISEDINEKKRGSIVKPKDILLNITGGSIGRCALVPNQFDIANVNQHVMIIRLINPLMRYYLHSVIISPYIQNQILSKQVGSGRGGLSAETLSTFLIPIPAYNEQVRITSSLNKLIPLISLIDSKITDLISAIKKSKSKILDLAIRGKLVPQNPDDEPASVLIERIRAEKEQLIKEGKIKRDKRESYIFRGEDNSYYEKIGNEEPICIDEELPFALPDGWAWCELQDCCYKEIKRGRSPKYADSGSILSFAQKCNQKTGIINIELALWIDDSTVSRYDDNEYMRDGDIVINSTGTGTLGRVGIYHSSDNPAGIPMVPDSHVTVVRTAESIVPQYVFFCLKAMQSELEELGEGSTNQKELKPLTIKQLRMPLPPIEEQQTIAQRILEAFEQLDYIETDLN